MSTSQPTTAQLRVMVIMAHPDDAEFTCGGTVASYTAAGARAEYVLATSGNRGSHEPGMTPEKLAAIREAEQRAAAEVLGVAEVTFLRYNDGEVEPSIALRRELALVLRKGRPDIVLTFDPWQHYQVHPDHRAIGQSTLDAIADARMPMYYPEQISGDVRDHRVLDVYFFATDHPNHWVDITETIDKKIAALRCHVSQVGDRDMDPFMRARGRAVGQERGMLYAEAFRHLPMIHPTIPGPR
ncbi:MAG TPA: PIG-L deacetylase family protein [Ktedonobacterales bacterium]